MESLTLRMFCTNLYLFDLSLLKLLFFFLIGHGDELIKYLPSPKTIDSLRRVNVKNVYAGGDVSFVIDQNGRLFGFGDGKKRKISVSYLYLK